MFKKLMRKIISHFKLIKNFNRDFKCECEYCEVKKNEV